MRTMKKIVALSLVLAMALSMMASAASFKDQSDINPDLIDEINLLVNLGVYSEQGTGAGFFEPSGTITRSQAAKMIYVLKNKGVDNGATSWTGLDIFNDVEEGAWYEGYTNYCASTGIIAGTGDNNFTPNGQLTGIELAKMLLVLIGYKADVEGYSNNANWDANILADAEAAGIFEGYELPVRGVITREWAAQMIVNALYANKVRYNDGVAEEMYATAADENNIAVYKPVTYAGQDLGLIEKTGIAIGTTKFTLSDDGAPTLHPDGTTSKVAVGEDDIFEIDYEITEDQLGQEVKVLYKDNDSFSGLTKNDKIYGVTVTGTSKVYEVNLADITVDKDKNTIKFAGYNSGDAKEYDAKHLEVMTYNNMHAKKADIDFMIAKVNKTPYTAKLIDVDNDGYIDVIFSVVPTIGKVTALNADKNIITIKASTNTLIEWDTEKEFDKVNFIDEIEKNDIVAGIYDYSTGKEILDLRLVDTVVGQITKLNQNSKGETTSYIIDGVTYKTASNYMQDATSPNGLTTDDETFYVEGNYVVYSEVVTSSADQSNIVLFLADNGEETGVFAAQKVQVMDASGTKTIYDYNVISDNAPTGYVKFADAVEGTAYEAVVADGKIYFKTLTTTNNGKDKATGSNIVYAGEKSTIALNADTDKYTVTKNDARIVVTDGVTITHELATTQIANDDAVFFVKNEKGWKAFKASELTSDFNGKATQFVVSKSGVPTIKYAVVEITGETYPTDSTTDAVYGILASTYTEYKVDDAQRYDINVTLMDGTTKTLTLEGEDNNPQGNVKKLVSFTENSKGIATLADTEVVGGNLEAFTGNTLYIGGTFMTLADDAKVYYVDYKAGDSATFTVAEGDGLVAAADGVEGTNILYKFKTNNDQTKTVTTIFVEIDGEAIVPDHFVLGMANND